MNKTGANRTNSKFYNDSEHYFNRSIEGLSNVSLTAKYSHTSLIVPDNSQKSLVVLVSLIDDRISFAGESLGIMAISGYLKTKKGADVQIFDTQLHSVDEIIDYVISNRPGLLGISIKHNTLSQLLHLCSCIDKYVPRAIRPITIVGNSIAAYICDILLLELLPDTLIGLGEGEVCMSDIFDLVNGERTISDVRNVAYLYKGNLIRRPIVSLNEKDYTLPDRSLSKFFYDQGGLIYIERSRGCSWGRCTFCGREHEPTKNIKKLRFGNFCRGPSWRAKDNNIVIDDLKRLEVLGIKSVRFADEDFVGSGLFGIQRTRELALAIIDKGISIQFDVIARVTSVYSKQDTQATRHSRECMWSELVKAGLVKVALGVETFDAKQLRRYGKGVTLEETLKAINIINHELKIECEIGFISVDVISTIDEIWNTLNGLQRAEPDLYASTAFKEMRVYHGTPYLQMVREKERQFNKKLLGQLNIDSLEYQIVCYLHPEVEILVKYMRQWNLRCYELFYMLRIYTNTKVQSKSEISVGKSIHHNILENLIQDLRKLEMQVMMEAVAILKHFNYDINYNERKIVRLIRSYEKKRFSRICTYKTLLGDKNYKIVSRIDQYFKRAKAYLAKTES